MDVHFRYNQNEYYKSGSPLYVLEGGRRRRNQYSGMRDVPQVRGSAKASRWILHSKIVYCMMNIYKDYHIALNPPLMSIVFMMS